KSRKGSAVHVDFHFSPSPGHQGDEEALESFADAPPPAMAKACGPSRIRVARIARAPCAPDHESLDRREYRARAGQASRLGAHSRHAHPNRSRGLSREVSEQR